MTIDINTNLSERINDAGFEYLDDNPSDEFSPPPISQTDENSQNVLSALSKATDNIEDNNILNEERNNILNKEAEPSQSQVELVTEKETLPEKLVEKQTVNEMIVNNSTPITENEVKIENESLSEQLFFDSQDQPPFGELEKNTLVCLENPIKTEQSILSEPSELNTKEFKTSIEQLSSDILTPMEPSSSKIESKKLAQLNSKTDRLVDEIALDFLIDKLAEYVNFDQLITDVLFYVSKIKSSGSDQVNYKTYLVK